MFKHFDQHRIFSFFIITSNSIQKFFFEWKEQNDPLHMQILNSICGWQFVRNWKDERYDFVTGKAVVMSNIIRQEVEELKNSFMKNGKNEHKEQISDLSHTIISLVDEETFFVYRLVYSFPTQTILLRIKTELEYIKLGNTKEKADEWYDKNAASLFNEYEFREYINIKQGEADKKQRICRFCHRRFPTVTFKKIAHAIPESIGGHRNLTCNEECDECNERFGAELESHLYNWFDIRRSLFGVTRKHGGAPNAYGRNYIIEDQQITFFLDIAVGDEIKAIGSGTVTLQGIYRALCKIAIDLIDSKYLEQLQTTIEWIRNETPKASKYPQIAQMGNLGLVDKPHLYIFTSKNGIDQDGAPLHFCILRIFNLAFLYTLPHVDGRMQFKPIYTDNINIEALKVFGLGQEWVWESYDTTEERNPHVIFDLSKSIITPQLISDKKGDSSKLRKEKKTVNSVDFIAPSISARDIIKHSINEWYCNSHLNAKDIIQTIGYVSSECMFDLAAHYPLSLRLKMVFENVRRNNHNATLTYDISFDTCIYKGQFEYSESSIAVNQILIVKTLELTLEHLFYDISKQYPDFPFTRDSLSINNANELLANMKIVFVKEGFPVLSIKGSSLWHSGYQ